MQTQLTGRGLITLSTLISILTIITLYFVSYFTPFNPMFIPGVVMMANLIGLPLLSSLVLSLAD